MDISIVDLNEDEIEDIESRLEKYDVKNIGYQLNGNINLGIKINGKLIAAVNAIITAYKILYVSTIFVDEEYRGNGLGKKLMETLENRAVKAGINMIRLDTFNWQGYEFYIKLGYELVGKYRNEIDNFSEYFFLKRI
jgi:ribosomal protein S18 acetylase RimI-like enzyme